MSSSTPHIVASALPSGREEPPVLLHKWEPVAAKAREILALTASQSRRAPVMLAEAWARAMTENRGLAAHELCLQMEAISILQCLQERPHLYSLSRAYYRLARLSQTSPFINHQDIVELHEEIRKTGVERDAFGDDPYSSKHLWDKIDKAKARAQKLEDEGHRRIRREL